MHTFKALSTLLLTVLVVGATPWSGSANLLPKRQNVDLYCSTRSSRWHGWSTVKNIFAFGDSYSTDSFSANDAQPSRANPQGNPDYLQNNTSADGPNYLIDLTRQYNQTFVKLFDLAFGGAAVNKTLTPELYPFIPDFGEQVDSFEEYYGGAPVNRSALWSADHTLFTVFFGINDLIITTGAGNDTIQKEIMASYWTDLQRLYSLGARNFVILKVPAFDAAPFVTDGGGPNTARFTSNVNLWNDRISGMAYNLTLSYRDTTVFLFDTYRIFRKVLSDTGTYLATVGITNTTGFCPAYGSGTPSEDFWNTTACPLPVNQYFWLNNLHPTWGIHDVMAYEIVEMLEENSYGRIYI